ncbi:hypothetical protein TNCV_2116061 [Trichonephila clavipes]|nr:hypothetical protein TNCV_2116061 [Trichonephila clavipes]
MFDYEGGDQPIESVKSRYETNFFNIMIDSVRALPSVDMLPWPESSPNLSPIEHVFYIIGWQPRHHPQPALSIPGLT